VFLIKLALTPVGLFSYVMGVSSISFVDFALGHISYLFWSCSLCFIGCSMSSAMSEDPAEKDNKTVTHVMLAIQILFTIIVTIVISYISKNALEKKVREK
jgi:uncharacterized membrane protein YdjX (TVP38/TMEM64 family)